MHYFVLTGSLCLIIALIQAWLLVAVFSSETSPVSRIIPGRQDLLKSHIDYLMMAQFLFIFFMLYRALALRRRCGSSPACASDRSSIHSLFSCARETHYLRNAPMAFVGMITVSGLHPDDRRLRRLGSHVCARGAERPNPACRR